VDLGVCYFNLGSSDEALSLFQKALAIEPNHPVALFNMGVVRESQNQFNEALDFYARASRAKDVPPPMLQGLAEATQRVKDKMSGAPPAMGGR
jgi:tetratricopeptide (TPR) repeat protein